MAILADARRQYMRRVLPGRICTVVTTCTIARDIDVIEIRRNPAS